MHVPLRVTAPAAMSHLPSFTVTIKMLRLKRIVIFWSLVVCTWRESMCHSQASAYHRLALPDWLIS